MQKYIGRQLKTARLNKKLTQEQIAEAVGLSAKHYGCIERGEVSTTVAVLTRLQQVLKFSLLWQAIFFRCFRRAAGEVRTRTCAAAQVPRSVITRRRKKFKNSLLVSCRGGHL